MSEQALSKTVDASVMEQVIIKGDLAALTPTERVNYYQSVCNSLGLNPLTKPFDYIVLNKKLTLYAKRDAAEQLRKRDNISVNITGREQTSGCYIVTAKARTPEGREDESTGVVSVANLKGDALANAMMKAETKAKRRVTLSIVGLGWLDETEIETIPTTRPAIVDGETGEIINGEAQVVEPEPATNTNKPEPRPFAPSRLAHIMGVKIEHSELVGPISANQLALLAGKLNEVWAGDAEADNNRRSVLKYLFAVDSAKELTRAQATVVLDWLIEGQDETGDYPLKPMAEQEAKLIVRQYVEDAGQLTMEMGEAE